MAQYFFWFILKNKNFCKKKIFPVVSVLIFLGFYYMEKFLRFTLIFLITYFLLSWLIGPNKTEENTGNKDDYQISLSDTTPTIGNLIEVEVVKNKIEGEQKPETSFVIEKYSNGEWENVVTENLEMQTGEKKSFSYPELNTQYFADEGEYRVFITYDQKRFEEKFEISQPGFWKSLWRGLFWKPVYNLMIFSLEISLYDLGFAIILLTLIIKLLLFVPTQNAMKSQRKMQKLQPELQAIKRKYVGNQQKIAVESMQLWKKHNISPFSAIIPILLQFPILIALFYVVQDGLLPHNSFFLYTPLSDFDFSQINIVFLGFLDLLTSPLQDYWMLWLPLLVGVVQFIAMKLSFAKMQKQREENQKQKPKNKKGQQGFMEEFQEEFQKMNKVFVYILPAIVTFFTATLPAAVGLYWLVSTVFSVGQQLVVNKQVK